MPLVKAKFKNGNEVRGLYRWEGDKESLLSIPFYADKYANNLIAFGVNSVWVVDELASVYEDSLTIVTPGDECCYLYDGYGRIYITNSHGFVFEYGK